MKKSLQKIIGLFTALLVLSSNAYAGEPISTEKGESYALFTMKCSKVALSEDDTFTVEYVSSLGEMGALEIDSSMVNGKFYINLPEAIYTVTGVTYDGKNTDIENAGYAVTTQFTCNPSGSGMLVLGIGKKETVKMYSTYESIVFKIGGEYENIEKAYETLEQESSPPIPTQTATEPAATLPETETSKTETLVENATADISSIAAELGYEHQETVSDETFLPEPETVVSEPEKSKLSLWKKISILVFFVLGYYAIYKIWISRDHR